MTQFSTQSDSFLNTNRNIYDVVYLANNANGDIVSTSNPLPVTLGSENITITGNVNFVDTVNVSSSPSNPVHTHVSEVGTSGILTVPYMPIDGNVNVNNIITITGNVTTNGTVELGSNTLAALENTTVTISGTPTVNVGNFPSVQTVNGTINIQSTGNQGKLWTMQISQGLIAGHTTEQITGYNPNSAAGDAVWSAGTPYPWSSLVTAQTLYLKSSTNNATDRNMSILIDGLDANYLNQTEVITLNVSDSRTAVTTTKQFLRIHSVMCNGTETNVGDITTHVTSGTGTIVSKMSSGRGRALAGVYTVPAGYTGYLFKGDASSTAATVVNFMGRYYEKAFMVLHVAIVDNSTYIYDFPFPMPLPEKTDMYTVIEAGSGKTAVNYEILLVSNT